MNRAREHITIVTIQSIDEAAVDLDAKTIQTSHHLAIVSSKVLTLTRSCETIVRERLESNKQTAQSGCCGFFNQIVPQNRIDGRSRLKDATHSFHAAEEISGETHIPQKMIVEKVE